MVTNQWFTRWWGCYKGDTLINLYKVNIARSVLVELPSSFFSVRLISVHVVHPYTSIDTTAAWKKLCFILSLRFDIHMTDSLLLAVHAFASCVLMSFSVDKTLLPRKVNSSISFRELPFSVEMSPLSLKHVYSVLSALTWKSMPAAAQLIIHNKILFDKRKDEVNKQLPHGKSWFQEAIS